MRCVLRRCQLVAVYEGDRIAFVVLNAEIISPFPDIFCVREMNSQSCSGVTALMDYCQLLVTAGKVEQNLGSPQRSCSQFSALSRPDCYISCIKGLVCSPLN